MCGRFTRKENFQNLAKQLGLVHLPSLEPRYNIAPSQTLACLRQQPDTKEVECVRLKWGLIPFWAKDGNIGNKMINARSETVADKPAFRRAFRRQRCLIFADGFYEWKRLGKVKQPYYIYLKGYRPFVFAGLWDRWERDSDTAVESCTMLTVGPNALMESIHHRMPVILQSPNTATWLDTAVQDPHHLLPLLQPYPSEEMEAHPVSLLVNNPQNDREECIQPVT